MLSKRSPTELWLYQQVANLEEEEAVAKVFE